MHSSDCLNSSSKSVATSSQPYRSLSDNISASLVLVCATGNPHPPQPRPVHHKLALPKGCEHLDVWRFRYGRTASPCPRHVPRGHGARGRPALGTAPLALERKRATRGGPENACMAIVISEAGFSTKFSSSLRKDRKICR